MNALTKSELIFAGVVGVAVIGLGVYVYSKRKDLGAAVNPLSSENVVYQAAGSVVQTLTGGKSLSVGDWLYSTFGSDTAGQVASASTYPSDRGPDNWDAKYWPKTPDYVPQSVYEMPGVFFP